jgi:hypothetical protein
MADKADRSAYRFYCLPLIRVAREFVNLRRTPNVLGNPINASAVGIGFYIAKTYRRSNDRQSAALT